MPERDRGAGTVLVLGIVAAVFVLTVLGVGAAGILLTHQQLARAADAAALAAADTLSGRISGYPCENAGRIAELASADLERCDIDGSIALVSLTKSVTGMPLRVRARAGPADVPGTPVTPTATATATAHARESITSWWKLSAASMPQSLFERRRTGCRTAISEHVFHCRWPVP